jgi:hypothetical protein
MFSYRDLLRLKIAMEAEQQFDVTISDSEMDKWLKLGDVARSIVGLASRPLKEIEVVDWVRTLLIEGCGAAEVATLTADGDVFSDYDRTHAWFLTPPYPSRLSDRCFATERGEHSSRLTEFRTNHYYCAYGAPTHLRILQPSWRTSRVLLLARQMSASLNFLALPILADALQVAGCDNSDILHHCRNPVATHIHGCWVVDLILGKGRYQS